MDLHSSAGIPYKIVDNDAQKVASDTVNAWRDVLQI